MQMPRSWRSAIPSRNFRSKRCSRSRSWIFGATSAPAHSRTVRSTSLCSSARSKEIMTSHPSAVLPDGLALGHDRLEPFLRVLGGHELVEVDVLRVAHGLREGQVEAAAHGPARALQDHGRPVLEALDERRHLGLQAVVGDRARDEAVALGVGRGHALRAQQHLEGLLAPDQTRQEGGGHGVEHAALHLGVPELRAGRGVDDVAGGREQAPRAQGRARHHRQRGLVRLGQVLEDLVELLEHDVRAVAEVVAELEAGCEVLAGRGEHDELDLALVLQRLEGGIDLPHRVDGEDVGGRAVEGEAGDALDGLEPEGRVGDGPRRGVGVVVDVFGIAHVQTASKAAASPMPPLMQRAASPRFTRRRAISCRRVTAMRTPVAPMGWPSAMAPPLTLIFSGSKRSSRSQARTWAANASLTSTRSKSSSRSRVFSSRRRTAGTTPMPITWGSTPAAATPRIRAIGRTPSCAARSASRTTMAAAPSVMPEEFPAVTVPSVSLNTVGSLAREAVVVSARGCSSRDTSISPPRAGTVLGT